MVCRLARNIPGDASRVRALSAGRVGTTSGAQRSWIEVPVRLKQKHTTHNNKCQSASWSRCVRVSVTFGCVETS